MSVAPPPLITFDSASLAALLLMALLTLSVVADIVARRASARRAPKSCPPRNPERVRVTADADVFSRN